MQLNPREVIKPNPSRESDPCKLRIVRTNRAYIILRRVHHKVSMNRHKLRAVVITYSVIINVLDVTGGVLNELR